MTFTGSLCRACALALALPGLLTTVSRAQVKGDPDLRAISAYTFTMPKYQRLMAAMVNLGKAGQGDSTLGGAMEDSGNLSIDQLVARYDKVPRVRRAIADAGLTTREFAVAQGAWLHSAMAYGLMKHYQLTPDSVSKSTGVSKANLEFFRANEAAIERMGKELKAQMPKEQPSDEADDVNGADAEADSTE